MQPGHTNIECILSIFKKLRKISIAV